MPNISDRCLERLTWVFISPGRADGKGNECARWRPRRRRRHSQSYLACDLTDDIFQMYVIPFSSQKMLNVNLFGPEPGRTGK